MIFKRALLIQSKWKKWIRKREKLNYAKQKNSHKWLMLKYETKNLRIFQKY